MDRFSFAYFAFFAKRKVSFVLFCSILQKLFLQILEKYLTIQYKL